MKKFRFAALLTTLALALVMPFAVAEETIDPAQLMEDVAGTYVPLFSVLNKPEYDDVWLSHSAEIVGEENAQMIADMMRASTTAEIYGPEAVEAYAADPESMRFDCYFTEGVSKFVFDGNTVTGLDEAGNEVFSHSYTYVQELRRPFPAMPIRPTTRTRASSPISAFRRIPLRRPGTSSSAMATTSKRWARCTKASTLSGRRRACSKMRMKR